jgi:hypothetical protein
MKRWIIVAAIVGVAFLLIRKTSGIGAAIAGLKVTKRGGATIRDNGDGTLTVTKNGITRAGVTNYRPLETPVVAQPTRPGVSTSQSVTTGNGTIAPKRVITRKIAGQFQLAEPK